MRRTCGVRDRVIVEVEADIGRLADRDRDALEQRRRVVGQRQQASALRRRTPRGRVRVAARPDSAGRRPGHCTRLGLGVEIVEIGEAAGGEEGVADVADGALDAALLVAARDRDGARLDSGSARQSPAGSGWKRIASPRRSSTALLRLSYSRTRGTPFQAVKAATWPRRKLSIRASEEEAQEDLARVAEHHDERHQRTARAADLEMAEMSPVDLRLLAGQAAQAQIGLGLRARPMAGDEVAEVIGRCRDSRARAPSHTAGWRSASGTSPASGG